MEGVRWAAPRLRLGVILISVALLAAACGGDDGAEEGAEAGQTIKVGSSLDLAPFEFIDEQGNPVGYEIEILAEIGERLGFEWDYVETPFDQAFTGLAANKFRLNASAIFIRCERIAGSEKVGDFTVPTYEEGQSVLIRAEDQDRITSVEDLEGLIIGVESRGSTADAVTDKLINEGLDVADKQIFPDNTALVLAVQQGRIDAAFQSTLTFERAIEGKPDLMLLPEEVPETSFPVGFLFREGDPLREDFNRVINEMKEDGTIVDLYEKWFERPPDPDSVTANVVPEVTTETCLSAV